MSTHSHSALRWLLVLSWGGLAGCGASAASLPPEQQEALCRPLLEQIGGSFGCRFDELTSWRRMLADAAPVFRAELTFRPDGRLARFQRLRAMDAQAEVPACVVNVVRGLRVPPREGALALSLQIRYADRAARLPSANVLLDGTCSVTAEPRR